jgi:hypothetical protein
MDFVWALARTATRAVDGERCAIVTAGHEAVELRFAECIVIPACVGAYTLRNTGQTACKVVKAFVKG